jgi:hypothetical protein
VENIDLGATQLAADRGQQTGAEGTSEGLSSREEALQRDAALCVDRLVAFLHPDQAAAAAGRSLIVPALGRLHAALQALPWDETDNHQVNPCYITLACLLHCWAGICRHHAVLVHSRKNKV